MCAFVIDGLSRIYVGTYYIVFHWVQFKGLGIKHVIMVRDNMIREFRIE